MQHNIRYRGGWQAPAMCTGQALSVNVYNPPLSSVLLGVTLIRLNGIYHCRVWSASIIKPPLSRWQLPGPSSGVAPELPCNPTSAQLQSAFLLSNFFFWGGGIRRPDSLRKQVIWRVDRLYRCRWKPNILRVKSPKVQQTVKAFKKVLVLGGVGWGGGCPLMQLSNAS